jgi:hypothetical protein
MKTLSAHAAFAAGPVNLSKRCNRTPAVAASLYSHQTASGRKAVHGCVLVVLVMFARRNRDGSDTARGPLRCSARSLFLRVASRCDQCLSCTRSLCDDARWHATSFAQAEGSQWQTTRQRRIRRGPRTRGLGRLGQSAVVVGMVGRVITLAGP